MTSCILAPGQGCTRSSCSVPPGGAGLGQGAGLGPVLPPCLLQWLVIEQTQQREA